MRIRWLLRYFEIFTVPFRCGRTLDRKFARSVKIAKGVQITWPVSQTAVFQELSIDLRFIKAYSVPFSHLSEAKHGPMKSTDKIKVTERTVGGRRIPGRRHWYGGWTRQCTWSRKCRRGTFAPDRPQKSVGQPVGRRTGSRTGRSGRPIRCAPLAALWRRPKRWKCRVGPTSSSSWDGPPPVISKETNFLFQTLLFGFSNSLFLFGSRSPQKEVDVLTFHFHLYGCCKMFSLYETVNHPVI